MFMRDNEVPSLAIVATHPMYSASVSEARDNMMKALYTLMGEPEEGLILIEQEVIEMESGNDMELTAASLVMSLQYKVGQSKLISLELEDSTNSTIH
jgi:hypothetical protein